MRRKQLIIAAFICLVTANAIPAFRLAGTEVLGFMASYLQFFAVLSADLEPGQRPAAAFGIIANLGFLATFIALSTGSRRLAKRTAIVAAASAFGSVTFLAAGPESFAPYPGCVLWLATAVLLVIASSGTNQMAISQTPNSARKRPRTLSIWLYGGMLSLILIGAWLGARYLHQSKLRRIDERIVAEVEASLTADLHALTNESKISQRYGKFKELTNVRWYDQPPFLLQSQRRLGWYATAHFENANAQISLLITKGSSLATHLTMNPARGGEVVVINGEFWEVNGDVSSHWMIDGWATHPEFLYE